MTLYNREIGFAFTAGAEDEIAALCKDGDLKHITGIMQGTDGESFRARKELVLILSRWHEARRAFFEPGYEEKPLTRQELDLLTMGQLTELQEEAFAAVVRDGARRVETEPAKKNGAP